MRASASRGVIMVLKGLLSFRVLIALATSASVTAAVAGPMAYQAAKAREEVVVVAAPTTVPPTTTTTTTEAPTPPPASTSTTTSTSSTTTTTIAGQPVPTTTTSTTTTTTPAITGAGLFSSVYSDHRDPAVLDRGRAGVRVWIFYDGPGVTSVSYWVDDPTGSGAPTRVASGPFDLDPAGTDWRVQYGLGTHTVLAEVTTIDGTFRRLATFEVFR